MVAKKFSTALAALSALLVSATPVAAMSIEISGNGVDSSNTTNVSVNQSVNILQTNNADIQNKVDVDANTGKNSASENTGGDVAISTGDASATVVGKTEVNSSRLSLGCCGVADASVSISGNGTDSRNKVYLTLNNNLRIADEKNLNLNNNFDVDVNTGKNKADKNTGSAARITTGDANALVLIDNKGNENVIIIGALNENPRPNPNPNPNPGVNPLPTSPAVLGISKLPMTGFDLPVKLILALSLGMIGVGVVLNKKASNLKSNFKTA